MPPPSRPLTLFGAALLTLLALLTMTLSLHFIAAVLAAVRDDSYGTALRAVGLEPLNTAAATLVGIGVALAVGRSRFSQATAWTSLLALRAVPPGYAQGVVPRERAARSITAVPGDRENR